MTDRGDATPAVYSPAAGPTPTAGGPASLSRWLARSGLLGGTGSWIPTWGLITTKQLELRKRRGLMVAVLLLTLGLPVLVLGIRLLFHAVDPRSYGPAGSPSVFASLCNPMADFGFIIAATLGASAGTTDLAAGVFRHLVITGRSRLALYLARIPAGLSILLPLVGVAFAVVCLVTVYEGVPQATSINENGISVPIHLNEAQLEHWIQKHPGQAETALGNGPPGAAGIGLIKTQMATIYGDYVAVEVTALNPAMNEMVKIGLWVELEVTIGFMVGLGLGSLIGQRTISTILMIVLEIIVTPILSRVEIPYFLNGQRLIVGVAMDQLRPAGLAGSIANRGGRVLTGAHGVLNIPPMPTWAMVAVIAGWIVGWSVIGAWRMATRDA
jgi:hypothetical protein